jgi:hypothetical protein
MSESLPPTVEPTAEACACCAEPAAAEREALDREALPLHAACRLDPKGQRQQRDRYRAIGKHLDRLEREPERLTAWLGPRSISPWSRRRLTSRETAARSTRSASTLPSAGSPSPWRVPTKTRRSTRSASR